MVYNCDMCNIEITEKKTCGNFYIKVMNQMKSNDSGGHSPIIMHYCSWECLEKFIKQEE